MATEVTFISKYTRHELLRQPRIEMMLPTGGTQTTQKRVSYQFVPTLDGESGQLVGELKVKPGRDVLVDHEGWLREGLDDDTQRDVVEALKAHRAFGDEFWLMPVPAAKVRSEIRRASVLLDADGLTALLEHERANSNRADLILEAEDALRLIGEMQAAQEQAAEEAATAKPKAKAKAPVA
jgi:hypothetical protein